MVLFKKKKAVTQPQEEEILFHIDIEQKIPVLPTFATKEQVDIRYPLIAPYAYAHIKWDPLGKELVYLIEEPQLTDKEKGVLKIIEDGIKELINISFISVKEGDTLIKFLEKNIKVLLNEMDISVPKDTFLKMMYYIYRDFVGLNELEPLMWDYFIEDIECNGVKYPLYIIHRKYRNLRTNVQWEDIPVLASFVEKLAQKCDKYVSYANPLLDGSLPEGSRVNATYTTDITSRGPSFSIRKFTKEPYSPIKLMQLRTVSPEMLAYLWILIEHEMNIMVVGGTGSGKTSLLNVLAFFIPPQARVVSIEDSVTGDSKIIIKENKSVRTITIEEFVGKRIDAEVMTLDKKGKIIFAKPSNYIKHNVKKDIYEIITSSGRKIKVTQDHSLFTLGEDNSLKQIKPTELKERESFIAVPRILPIKGNYVGEINLFKHLTVFKDDFLQGKPLEKLFKMYSCKDLKVSKERYKWWKKHKIIKVSEFIKLKTRFNRKELLQLRIKSKNKAYLPLLFKVNKEFLEFCGLWLGDGSYDNHNKNAVILSNVDKECRDVFKNVAAYLNSNYSVMSDGGVSLKLHNSVFYKFMKFVLRLDGYSDTKKIPEFIFGLSNEQIKHFIRGYFSADGCVKKYEVSCASQSYELLEDLQSILLRLEIISRINDFGRKDKCINLSVSSFGNIKRFNEIGFLQERKNKRLCSLQASKAHHTVSDIIPLSNIKINELNTLVNKKLSWPYLVGMQHIGREYLQNIAPKGSEFNDISHTDILWDKVKKIKKIISKSVEVFDLSIPKYEKFLCNNIFVHNTRELNLMHDNWLPSVAREGVGLANIIGQKYGEVSLFDLLKESFRQNPDYVIVGEVRGPEAYVLFQGMASGHPSFGTMHADSVETMVRRLETPPINLSPSLVNSMDAVCVMASVKVKGQSVRKLREITEVISIKENGNDVVSNVFWWDPRTDNFFFKGDSSVINKIVTEVGIPKETLMLELKRRSQLLLKLYRTGISDWREVQSIINDYYNNPASVLTKYGIA